MAALQHFELMVDMAGLADPRVLEAAGFKGAVELAEMALADGKYEVDDQVLAAAARLLASAPLRADLERRRRRAPGDEQLYDSYLAELAAKRLRTEGAASSTSVSPAAPWCGSPAARVAWRPREKIADTLSELNEKDLQLRRKWALRLVASLRAGGAPSLVLADAAGDPVEAALGLTGRARPSTVHKRVRAWELFARWLKWRRGRAWPEGPVDYVDYLAETLQDGGAVSFPETFRGAVNWLEARSGFEADLRYGGHPLFRKNVERAAAVLGCEAPGKRQAPRLPLVVIAALECHVVAVDSTLASRVLGWCRLLKTYGVLRQDDLQRLRPVEVTLGEGGLSGRLLQTKTSGAGKKVRELPLHVPRDCYLIEPRWLETGFELWESLGPHGRDFFLPRPREDMLSFSSNMAKPNDFAALNRAVLGELRRPIRGEDGWGPGSAKVLPDELVAGWSGHSERCTLPSLLAAAGVPKAERDPLGRWSPSGSDDYVRSYRAVVRNLARRFRQAVLAPNAFYDLDEEEAYVGAGKFARRFCGPGGQAENERLQCCIKDARDFLQELSTGAQGTEACPAPAAVGPRLSPTEAVDDEPEEEDVPAEEYIISVSGTGLGHRAKKSRLHRRNGCYRARQLRFQNFEVVNFTPVPDHMFDSVCKACWPSGGPGEEVSSGSSSSSSSSRCTSPTEVL